MPHCATELLVWFLALSEARRQATTETSQHNIEEGLPQNTYES